MYINKITSTNFTGTRVMIERTKNPTEKYLNNKVMDLVNQNKTTTIVNNKGIELLDASKELLENIAKLGVVFEKISK